MARFARRPTVRRAAVAIASALLVAACSSGTNSDEASSYAGAVNLSTAVLSTPRSAPLGNSDFLPVLVSNTDQARWVEVADEFCVRSLAGDEPDRICTPIDPETTIDLASLTWSADGSALYFNDHPSFALSPDGNSFVVARRADEDRDHELLGYDWQPSASLSEPIVIAPAGFLGTDESGEGRGIFSSPTFQSMVWTDNDQLLMLSADQALVFQLADPAAD